MSREDGARGTEDAQIARIVDAPAVDGTRMEEDAHGKADEQAKRNAKLLAPRDGEGAWVPVQVADDPAGVYRHEEVWVEHHGMANGHWAPGQLYKWEAAE
jgi:hypothetical protein